MGCSTSGRGYPPPPYGAGSPRLAGVRLIRGRRSAAHRITLVSEKILRFQNKNKDLNSLSQQILQQLQSEGYRASMTNAPLGTVIQAQKGGIMRDLVAAERAFTIMVTGQPNDFSVHIGVGKFFQNLGVMAVEALLLSELFLAVDVPEMLWTEHVEKGLANEITRIVG